MWLAVSWNLAKPGQPKDSFESSAAFMDILCGLGPDLYSDLSGSGTKAQSLALVSLYGLDRYWQLESFARALDFWTQRTDRDPQHPLLLQLIRIHHRFCQQSRFVLAPTAPWARFLSLMDFDSLPSRQSQTQPMIERWTSADIAERILPQLKPQSLSVLIDDCLDKSAARYSEFAFFCEALEDLGYLRASDFLQGLKNFRQEFQQRFGVIVSALHKRLVLLSDDYSLPRYVAPTLLEQSLALGWEQSTGIELEKSIFERVEDIFKNWQWRCESRRSLFRFVEVEVQSERRSRNIRQRLSLARASRESQTWIQLFREFWCRFKDQPHSLIADYPDEISSLLLRTSVLEPDRDCQLNLLNPRQEELSEKWHTLIARLQTRAQKTSDIRVGTFVPQASFFPEKAVVWRDWQDVTEHLPCVQDHPSRPEILLKLPELWQEFEIKDYEDFLFYLEKEKALSSLEKISTPWGPRGWVERSYARVKNQWIYWDHGSNQIFRHGYFESMI
jgi:hypothetical protein